MPESKKRKRGSKKVQSNSELHPTWSEGMKQSPRWYAPLAVTIMLVGLLWMVVHYALALNLGINMLGIGNWNIAIGFGVIMVGFIMLMWWK
ncbi:MAG: cell division protein CrgA [Mobiluncus porci]|uniref:cell division protein CrgA n=1 Tax=Mobiluncus porci TaxID=2652278 RepID=UPI0023F1C0B5|nr:cell division protein CrgA [Mobiluncus porci]MDD7541073.1 cell division protein CrgA [Mobiluncus porci]MDY5747532.1 cell division protein CrgA [Mobiluncus porci]